MKHINYYFFGIVLTCFLTSCAGIYEEITIKSDGTGYYRFYAEEVEGKVELHFIEDSIAALEDTTGDFRRRSREEIRAEVIAGLKSDVDTVMYFPEKIIASKVEMTEDERRMLKKSSMFMNGGKTAGYFEIGIQYPYADLEEIEPFKELMRTKVFNSSLEQTGVENDALSEYTFHYELEGNIFKRTYTPKQRTPAKPKDQEMYDEFIKGLTENPKMNHLQFTTVIHLPKPVKEVKSSIFNKINGKTVIFRWRLVDLLSEENIDLSFEIIMEE